MVLGCHCFLFFIKSKTTLNFSSMFSLGYMCRQIIHSLKIYLIPILSFAPHNIYLFLIPSVVGFLWIVTLVIARPWLWLILLSIFVLSRKLWLCINIMLTPGWTRRLVVFVLLGLVEVIFWWCEYMWDYVQLSIRSFRDMLWIPPMWA